jgi:hypothetical protein
MLYLFYKGNIKMENWKLYHNYLISDLGRVMNGKTGRMLKLHDDRRGYLKCLLYHDGKGHTYKVHYLVMLCFIGERPVDTLTNEPLQIDHIDRNRYNNHLTNLRFVTRKENCRNKNNYHADITEQDPKKRKKLIAIKKKNILSTLQNELHESNI